MFTDTGNKIYNQEHIRQKLINQRQELLTTDNQKKKTNSKDSTNTRPISVGKSTPNSKLIINLKRESTKKETPNLRSNAITGSPTYLIPESVVNGAKQQNKKQTKIVKKSKQVIQTQKKSDHVEEDEVQISCDHRVQLKIASATPQISNRSKQDREIELKTSQVSKKNSATPKTQISNDLKNSRSSKPSKEYCQVLPCSVPEIKINGMIRTSTPRGYQGEFKPVTTATEKPNEALQKVLTSTLNPSTRDTLATNAACLTELARKEHYCRIQQIVEKAIKNHKIFLIRGDIPYLEESMRTRGWVQKYESTKSRMVPYGSVASLDAPSLGNIHMANGTLNEKAIVFQILRHVPPDFIWDCRNEFTDWNSNIKQSTLLNRFQKSFIYTSKLGMATILEDAHWNYEENVSTVQCPRSYNVGRDKTAFIEDYRMTAAVSLLKWFVEQIQKGVELAVRGSTPISLRQVEFAVKQCEQFVAVCNNEHLDTPQNPVTSQEWDLFVQDYLKAVHQEDGFIETTEEPPFPKIEMLYETANTVLKKVKEVDPQFELNGHRNIWILKPSDLCCGAGIVMTHKLNHIMKRVHDSAKDYFVVQKYIEKPLLVHDTKFDVRQWYLVTKSYPLTIWIYKESFLRFSSRPFSFASYHEAVHICNTAVQCKYNDQRNSVRAKNWDCEKINEYLKNAGYDGEPWHDKVYPKMREAIIATMLAAQQHMDKRRCSFELYGADFVIMNDLSVWLIEINTNPRMHPPSTKVTERLYPDVMESLVKVILDYPGNPNTDTGNFVLAYQQNVTTFQPYLGASMFVLGKAINQKSKGSHDRENLTHPWTPVLNERQNAAALVSQENRKGEDGNLVNVVRDRDR